MTNIDPELEPEDPELEQRLTFLGLGAEDRVIAADVRRVARKELALPDVAEVLSALRHLELLP